MTQEEFTRMTDATPSPEEFDAIHALYMASNLDKEEFCQAYVRNNKLYYAKSLLVAPGAELHRLATEINQLKSERREMAIFIAEQAEVSSNSALRAKAIEMMGEAAYITWKIENEKNLWQLDRELIKKLINH